MKEKKREKVSSFYKPQRFAYRRSRKKQTKGFQFNDRDATSNHKNTQTANAYNINLETRATHDADESEMDNHHIMNILVQIIKFQLLPLTYNGRYLLADGTKTYCQNASNAIGPRVVGAPIEHLLLHLKAISP